MSAREAPDPSTSADVSGSFSQTLEAEKGQVVYIHSIVTTSTGWETPLRVTGRGAEIGNRVAAIIEVAKQDSGNG
jgi:hypothetical protein